MICLLAAFLLVGAATKLSFIAVLSIEKIRKIDWKKNLKNPRGWLGIGYLV